MKLTELLLNDPSEYLELHSGVKMIPAEVDVTRDGILTFGPLPNMSSGRAAMIILARNEAGLGVTLYSDEMFTGLQTHYEKDAIIQKFNTVSSSDEDSDVVKLFGPEIDNNGFVIPVESAKLVTWALCSIVNRKTS